MVVLYPVWFFENLIAAGVIDPTKVAAMLLTTECVIADAEEEAPMPPMGGGMPGGMGGMM